MSSTTLNTNHVEEHHDSGSVLQFGVWVFILSDLIIFATLFANFAIFGSSYSMGPAPMGGLVPATGEVLAPLVNLKFVLIETFLLLFSSITYGFAMVEADKNNLGGTRLWLGITFLLGIGFISMEVYEFHHLLFGHFELANGEAAKQVGVYYHDAATKNWAFPDGRMIMSAYWSSFFALVGAHGMHVTTGLIWMAVMFFQLNKTGLDSDNKARLGALSLFWHFLDVVWIGVFTAVYLIGALPSGGV